MQASRGLLTLVIVMGVLIVGGTTALVGVIAHRLLHPHQAPIATTAPAPVPGQAALSAEPSGTRILALVRQTDTLLAIALTGGGEADRVLVWDVAANRPFSEIRLQH